MRWFEIATHIGNILPFKLGGAFVGARAERQRPSSRAEGLLPSPVKVLLFSCAESEHAPLLAARLASSGFKVDALCPARNLLACSAAVDTCHRHGFTRPLKSLRAAIATSRPTLIVPCDDGARYTLSNLHRICSRRDDEAARNICALLARSLGRPEHLGLVEEKSQLLEALAGTGIRIPATVPVPDVPALEEVCRTMTFPFVLKRDRTSGGLGVVLCRSREEAMDGYRRLVAPPTPRDTLREVVRKGDLSALKRFRNPPRPVIVAQAYIEGRPANSVVGCLDGEILASLTVDVLQTDLGNPFTPACVVQIGQSPEMDRMTHLIVQRLGLSGICGADFIVEARTGLPYFLEINPRATPTCSLGRARGSDIAGALWRALNRGAAQPESHEADMRAPIALFPGEWRRDPNSPYLASGHHAIPWDDPKVLVQILNHPRQKSTVGTMT